MKFILDNKDFDSSKADVPGQKTSLEIVKLNTKTYAIFEHSGDAVGEVGCFNKEELRTIWLMLCVKE